jgi:2-polyprenyl-6-methoxyphenol hydroxylase-like FAD-dependent oxidoreductase
MIDVLVVGAGPTGLMMAAELARFGLSCRIIEQNPTPSEKSRALAIQPRTLEIFDHLGIIDRFLEKGTKVLGARSFFGSEPLAHISLQHLDSPYPFILSLEQSITEQILEDYLSSFGIQVEREVELIDLQEEESFIKATVCNHRSNQREEIQGKWVVGCDGAHSITRKLLQFPFEGKAFPTIFSLADVEIDWQRSHDELCTFLDPNGVLAMIPMPGKNRYRLVFQLAAGNEEIPPTLSQIQQKVSATAGSNVRVFNPLWIANFHIHNRLVAHYQKGRIFLAGDAAHIHSPVGGQGMNSGLQDAFNLGWKLASNNQKIMATYSLERHFWGRSLVKATWRFTKLATLRNRFGIGLRNWILRKLVPHLQDLLARAIGQLSIRYPKNLLVQKSGFFCSGVKEGTRAPNVPVGQSDLYSILRKSTLPHLLLFGYPSLERKGFVSLEMKDPKAWEIYGVKKPCVYLVRPDQYIGYRGDLLHFRQRMEHLF